VLIPLRFDLPRLRSSAHLTRDQELSLGFLLSRIDHITMAAPQGGWMRGIVKEVVSGDTVVVMAAVKTGIPPEKRLTLSSLQAPRMVSCT
jgi:hypothetical protein